MGKSAGSPPPAPDPTVTANAQAESNAKTARLQANLNRVDQVTPYGQVRYSQGAAPMDRNAWINSQVEAERAKFQAGPPQMTGTVFSGAGDQGGNNAATYTESPAAFDEAAARARFEGVPTPEVLGQDRWTQTTTLSPEQQRLLDLAQRGQTTYGETANNLLDAVRGQLSQPVNVDWAAERDRALAAQMGRINPSIAAAEEGLRSRLLNSGLTPGSEGWEREFRTFQQGRNDALMAADLNAGNTVGQAINQQAALRSMPLNEVSALLSGSQVNVPQANPTQPVNVAPTDVMGAYNNQYQGQLAAWNAQNQANNSTMGGLFGLAGTLGGAAMKYGPALISDARLKDNIRRIGTADNGLPIYAFQYKGDDTPRMGLMAQDVLHVKPDAVVTMPNGFMAVDYGKALQNG